MIAMTTTSSLVGTRLTRRINAAFLWAVFVICGIAAILALIFGIGGIVSDLNSGSAWLTMLADKTVPTAGLGGGSATGSYETAVIHVQHLNSQSLGLAVTAEIAATLVQASLFALVTFLAWRLLRGRALRRSLAIVVSLAGAILVIGGAVQAGAESIAPALAAEQLNRAAHNHFWPLGAPFDASSIGVGFVLLVVALVFGYGARLQKDAEGLV
jgi:hypothetical protein